MIIGLTGYQRAGKDTVASIIEALVPFTEIRSFAGPLKASAAALLGVTVDQLDEWKVDPMVGLHLIDAKGGLEAPNGVERPAMTIREYLQRYGTEAHRDVFGRDFWVDMSLPIDGDYESSHFVFTDLRFPNEAQRVRELGGVVWLIDRPGHGPREAHASEAPLPLSVVDRVIRNDGTTSELSDVIYRELHVLQLI